MEELSHSLMMLRQKICKNMARYFKSQTKGKFLYRTCQEVARGQSLACWMVCQAEHHVPAQQGCIS